MATKRTARPKRKEVQHEIETAIKSNFNPTDFKFKHRDFKFTDKQKQLMEIINDHKTKVVFIEGPAGTSKTFVSVYCGLMRLKERISEKIIYLRSVVESSSKSMGFLPGEASEKLHPYAQVCSDKIAELIDTKDVSTLQHSELIETMAVNFIRGNNWRNTFIIADEAQNFTSDEILTTMTRIAENSVMIICGDRMQSDIKNSGFARVFDLFDDDESKLKGIHTFKFDENDIVRSAIVRFIVKKFKQLR